MINFEDFITIAKAYCLSKCNNIHCKRYILNKHGEKVPKELHPDGTMVELKK